MLREPRKIEKAAEIQQTAKKGRFRFVKLEARIAPLHTNPHGKKVGHGKGAGF
jgi:hypothetical protein